MLNSSVHAASTAASTTGRYSGRQPAITALIATFSTVHSTRSGGTTATTSSGRASCRRACAATRSASAARRAGRRSSRGRTSPPSRPRRRRARRRRDRSFGGATAATAGASAMSGSSVREPQPGRKSGRSAPRPATPVSCLPLLARPALGAGSTTSPSSTRSSVGTVSMSSANDTSRSRSSSRRVEPVGKGRVVLREDGERRARREVARAPGATSPHVGHVALHDGDEAVGRRIATRVLHALQQEVDRAGEHGRRRRARSPGTARSAAGCGRACGTARRRRCRSRAAWPRARPRRPRSSKSIVAVTGCGARRPSRTASRTCARRPSRRRSRADRSQRPAANSSPPLSSIHCELLVEQEQRGERGRVVRLVEPRVLDRDRQVEGRRHPARSP